MPNKRNYIDESVTFEMTPVAPVQEQTKTELKKAVVEITSKQYTETLASYMNDPFQIIPIGKLGDGKCLICGVETQKKERHICAACMKTFKNELYNGFQKGDDMIELNS